MVRFYSVLLIYIPQLFDVYSNFIQFHPFLFILIQSYSFLFQFIHSFSFLFIRYSFIIHLYSIYIQFNSLLFILIQLLLQFQTKADKNHPTTKIKREANKMASELPDSSNSSSTGRVFFNTAQWQLGLTSGAYLTLGALTGLIILVYITLDSQFLPPFCSFSNFSNFSRQNFKFFPAKKFKFFKCFSQKVWNTERNADNWPGGPTRRISFRPDPRFRRRFRPDSTIQRLRRFRLVRLRRKLVIWSKEWNR